MLQLLNSIQLRRVNKPNVKHTSPVTPEIKVAQLNLLTLAAQPVLAQVYVDLCVLLLHVCLFVL